MFEVIPAREETAKYCSYSCKNSKENNPTWKGGNAKSLYHKEARRIAYESFDKKCMICDFKEGNRRLNVHHKDKNWKNNSPENLIILCRDCHNLWHSLERYNKQEKDKIINFITS
jgi:5-methylcytosine-specific restriction endonuclease McrA